MTDLTPAKLSLKRDEALTVTWADGSASTFPVRLLRAKCPCAGCKDLREQMKKSRLAVIQKPIEGQITVEKAEKVGNYAIKLTFSDGHDVGIYSWAVLREMDPLLKND